MLLKVNMELERIHWRRLLRSLCGCTAQGNGPQGRRARGDHWSVSHILVPSSCLTVRYSQVERVPAARLAPPVPSHAAILPGGAGHVGEDGGVGVRRGLPRCVARADAWRKPRGDGALRAGSATVLESVIGWWSRQVVQTTFVTVIQNAPHV